MVISVKLGVISRDVIICIARKRKMIVDVAREFHGGHVPLAGPVERSIAESSITLWVLKRSQTWRQLLLL